MGEIAYICGEESDERVKGGWSYRIPLIKRELK